jgi:hypothetical protein
LHYLLFFDFPFNSGSAAEYVRLFPGEMAYFPLKLWQKVRE